MLPSKSFIVLLIFISFPILAQKASLKKRANSFHKAVTENLTSKKDYFRTVSPFFDPRENVDSLTLSYYSHWKNTKTLKNFPMKVKIKKIKFNSSSTAVLTLKCHWFDISEGISVIISQSIWHKIDGIWYRSALSEKRISEKVKYRKNK